MVEEILYPALEDYQIDIMIGEGPAARSVRLDLQPFTLVGATTRAGMLTNPLRDRFGIVARLEFYTPAQLARIVTRSSALLNAPIAEDGALEIARRSRGTPRVANRLLKRVRDFAEVRHTGAIDEQVATQALDLLERILDVVLLREVLVGEHVLIRTRQVGHGRHDEHRRLRSGNEVEPGLLHGRPCRHLRAPRARECSLSAARRRCTT